MTHVPLPTGYTLRYRWRHAPNAQGRQHTLIYIVQAPDGGYWLPSDCNHRACGCVEMLPIPAEVVESWLEGGWLEDAEKVPVAS